jgi:hypothetical protein
MVGVSVSAPTRLAITIVDDLPFIFPQATNLATYGRKSYGLSSPPHILAMRLNR